MNETKKLGALLAPGQQPSDLMLGTVVSVEADASLTADVRGGQIPGVRYLSHVTPRPGYSVVLQRIGNDLVAVGSLAQLGWPACRVRREADSTTYAAGSSPRNVTFDTVVSDVWDMWNGGTNVVAPIPGFYDLSGILQFDTDGTGSYRGIQIQVNSSVAVWDRRPPISNAGTLMTAAAVAYPLETGDIVSLCGEHNSTTNRYHVGGTPYRSALSVSYRGPIGE